ncbi:phosphorylase family protein [Methylovirgula sp. 4M-Z18]|uniref:phosphorylase family protein n=1 Tax=Methylovirgula sp. 4M-Z18 TaxID=2293567 RepID=UPI000E2F9174|nr:phosphorylase [Methylovirgula sp. 4M-Z18]RFB76422.1 phosphorylase [Methylovirgula sp. 4M-Z18]
MLPDLTPAGTGSARATRDQPQVIAACGLELEARMTRGIGVPTVCGAARADLLRQRLALSLGVGRTVGLVSFGLAGGLAPELAPGTLVLPNRVVEGNRSWNVDADWLRRLRATCDEAVCADVAGSDVAISTPHAKRQLRAATGASIVDMESHVVAEVARVHGLPFVVIRAVADTAQSTLPSAALIQLRSDGRPDIGRILIDLVKHPGQMGEIVNLARLSRSAATSLGRVCQMLGPGLGCPYFL